MLKSRNFGQLWGGEGGVGGADGLPEKQIHLNIGWSRTPHEYRAVDTGYRTFCVLGRFSVSSL